MYRANKTKEDVLYILDHLRDEDLQELRALWGEEWKQKTLDQIMHTDFYVMLGKTKNKDVPVVMGGFWGTDSTETGVGVAWLLSTDLAKDHQVCLLREFKKEMEKADEKFWVTHNIIYKTSHRAKRWLKWLGFRFPNDEEILTPIDTAIINTLNPPEGFEVFYRLRPIKGLG